MEPN
ncbi:hypothetical protein E2I00_014811 [Balaenoptera physalus]|jgi:hypothetical protein